MVDESTLRERFPEIPWDQPVPVLTVTDFEDNSLYAGVWVCRICVARYDSLPLVGYDDRAAVLDHIEREHHD